jgi:hypothetical protein
MRRLFSQRAFPAADSDLRKARWELHGFLRSPHTKILKFDEILDKLELIHLGCNEDDFNLMDICCRNDVNPSALYDYCVTMDQLEIKQAEERLKRLNSGEPMEEPKDGKNGKKFKSVTQQLNPAQLDLEIQKGRTSSSTPTPHWSDTAFEGYKNQHGGHEGQGSGA